MVLEHDAFHIEVGGQRYPETNTDTGPDTFVYAYPESRLEFLRNFAASRYPFTGVGRIGETMGRNPNAGAVERRAGSRGNHSWDG